MRCQMMPLTARLAEAHCSTDEQRPISTPAAAFAKAVSFQMEMQVDGDLACPVRAPPRSRHHEKGVTLSWRHKMLLNA